LSHTDDAGFDRRKAEEYGIGSALP